VAFSGGWGTPAAALTPEQLAERRRKNARTLKWLGISVGVFLLLGLIGSIGGKDKGSGNPDPLAASVPSETPEAVPSPTPKAVTTTPAKAPVQALVAPRNTTTAVKTTAPVKSTAPARTTAPKPRVTTNAPTPAKVYANCTELRKDYSGGVALPGAVNQGGTTNYEPYYSRSLYEANSGKDRDKDGIACEA
jgi:hypothetical protein